MKAIIYHNYGSPEELKMAEINKPAPKAGEVLVKVYTASVNQLDWHLLTGKPFMVRLLAGLFKPKNQVLGIDAAGRVEAVGAGVSRFKPGDEVFGSSAHGCFAEYVCIPENELAIKPAHVSSEEAAAIPAAARTAFRGLCDCGKLTSGQKVLINGASGGVGTYAVQIAKSYGAKVTAVCSTRNLDMVRSIGADQVIDYTREDFTQTETNYDLVFDVAAKRSFEDCKRVLKPDGIYVTTEFSPALLLKSKWAAITGSQRLVPVPPVRHPEDLIFIKKLLETGRITSVIKRTYSLDEVPEALAVIGEGHTQGKIVVKVI